ncbi:histidine kinase dimerization/phosphoacceptor domain -containing protein [Reichenbachiella sp.]|uniref:sensor histidine kinase n=1 Tax=Reichenbachiella sp. TaxID=2184521 RepID=UPI003BB1C8F2
MSVNDRIRSLIRVANSHTDLNEGIRFALQALELAKKNEISLLEAYALEEIGMNKRLLGKKEESYRFAIKAYEIYERLDNKRAQSAVLVQLGSNAVVDKEYLNACKFFKEAIFKFQQDSIIPFGNLAMTMLNLGEAYRLYGKLDSAASYFQRSLELQLEINDQRQKAIVKGYATGNLGMVYNAMDSLGKARSYLIKAIKITQELGDPYSTAVYMADLGLVEQKEGNFSVAEDYFLEAHDMALKEGLKEQVRDISLLLVEFYEQQELYAQAFSYQKIFQNYQDSLVNKENIQKVEQVKAQYEIDKRETEIELLGTISQQRTYLAVGLAIGVLFFVGFSIILYHRNEQKKTTNLLLAQQKETISIREHEKGMLLHELNHRVKNNLQMISSLLNMQSYDLNGHPAEEAISESKHRVDALSLIHQKLYQADQHTEISAKEYFNDLVKNLVFSYNHEVKPQLELSEEKVKVDLIIPLALIVNELVINSLKHAFEGVAAPCISVSFQVRSGGAVLEVGDNGQGLDPSVSEEGFGLKLVRSLVKQLDGNLKYMNDNCSTWILTMNFNP